MAGDVDVAGPVQRQGSHELERIETEVEAIDVDVVDVEVQQAVGLAHHGRDEFGFAHLGAGRCDVVGGVLDAYAHAEDVLGATDAIRHPAHGLGAAGNRQQVIELAVVAAPRKMFGIEAHAVLAHEALDPAQ